MNPFEAFRSYSATRRELPLDRILPDAIRC